MPTNWPPAVERSNEIYSVLFHSPLYIYSIS